MKSIKGLIAPFCIFSLTAVGLMANPTFNETVKGDIFSAIRAIDYTTINILLSDEDIDIDTVDQNGNTPLMVAARVGNPRIMDIILSHNPNMDLQNKSGATALIIAAESGQLAIVKKLVDRGVDVMLRDLDGQTALNKAATFGHEEIVAFFKKRGNAHT